MLVEFSEQAQNYLKDLLDKQGVDDMAVRVYVNSPGTPQAETCLAYNKPGEQEPTDQLVEGLIFPVFLDYPSLKFLEDAKVDFQPDDLGGGQLTIAAPNARLPMVDENSPIDERVNYVLHSEVNPGLAAHGGAVSLVEMVEEDTVAILRFGGGCQGCDMVDYTLKQGVESTLIERIPQLRGVRDVTDHSDKTNAYY